MEVAPMEIPESRVASHICSVISAPIVGIADRSGSQPVNPDYQLDTGQPIYRPSVSLSDCRAPCATIRGSNSLVMSGGYVHSVPFTCGLCLAARIHRGLAGKSLSSRTLALWDICFDPYIRQPGKRNLDCDSRPVYRYDVASPWRAAGLRQLSR